VEKTSAKHRFRESDPSKFVCTQHRHPGASASATAL